MAADSLFGAINLEMNDRLFLLWHLMKPIHLIQKVSLH